MSIQARSVRESDMVDNNKHKFNESIENHLAKIVVDDEYQKARAVRQDEMATFESILDKFECKHTEKDYSWMSDIEYPHLASIVITDASGWANQYFQTRDFVEVKLEGVNPQDKKKCSSAKKCLNQTLNNRDLNHYSKYIRARTLNALYGQVYALCWWEQKYKEELTGYNSRLEEAPEFPGTNREINEPVYDENITVDRFNYEIVDPRNIFTDNKYVYSPQEKDWITIRSEISYDQLETKKEDRGYFNLELAKKLFEGTYQETETAKETYNERELSKNAEKPVVKYLDHLLRFGKIWAIVKEKDEEGLPLKIVPGIDEFGKIDEKAILIESIIEFIYRGSNRVLIRFQPTPYRDTRGNSYKPIVRGLCYIHPTKDVGLSSGRYLSEIQTAISDHFNMGSDRVKLATLPTFKGRQDALVDNTTIYFEPQHVIEVPDPANDLIEFKIQDNIDGTIKMISMLDNSGQRLEAVYPTTMGQLPEKSSTTATAVAGAETRTTSRANYKSLTFEYTFNLDFYWMILQMTWAFVRPKTAFKMMGEDAYYFDPDAEYSYSPVSSNIETEYNKYRKLQVIDQFIGRLVKVPNPNIWKLLNYLLKKAFELFGDDFPDYKELLLDEKATPPEAGGAKGEGQIENMAPTPVTNQTGTPQSLEEQMVRGAGI